MATKNITVLTDERADVDIDEIETGLRLGNWIWWAVNRPALSELPVPDRHHFPRTPKPKGGR